MMDLLTYQPLCHPSSDFHQGSTLGDVKSRLALDSAFHMPKSMSHHQLRNLMYPTEQPSSAQQQDWAAHAGGLDKVSPM
jgi:hypothetical protein